jgi:hypothetical protein
MLVACSDRPSESPRSGQETGLYFSIFLHDTPQQPAAMGRKPLSLRDLQTDRSIEQKAVQKQYR